MNTLLRIHNRPWSSGRCRAALQRFPFVSVAALLLCGLPCVAQQPPAGGQNLTSLEGVVVNALTGKPVPRALVRMFGGVRRAVLTGDQGEFEFEGVPVGHTSLLVQKPGYSQEGTSNFNSAATFEVTAGSGKAVIKLVPECVIAGQVSAADGEPLEGAQLTVLHSEVIAGMRRLLPAGQVHATDEDGNFRVAGLVPGKYYVAVRAANAARRILGAQSGKRKQAYPPVLYYPSALDLEAAALLDLTAAQHMDIRLSLKLEPAYKISGVISGIGDWKQVNNPWLTDRSGQILASAEQFDRATGVFEFQAVPAGNYLLRIGAVRENGQFNWTQRPISVDADVTGLKLALGAATAIPVMVRTEFSSKESLARCTTLSSGECDATPVHVTLYSADSPFAGGGYASDNVPGNPLSRQIANVSPGRYMVQVHSLVGGYVQSVRSGGANLLREDLVVPTEGSVPPIEITLRDDGGTVKVHVNSDQASAKAWALVVSESAPRLSPVLLNVGPGVDREYGGLAPGDYKVFAFDSTDGLEYTNPSVLSRYSSKASRVSIMPKATSSVSADLIHKDEE
ncbi:MAG: carboxypeptidase-like regulatory domain-containing protein [Acidobacteriia bacterium]|nr:carboxypeptidase-like regulatory domain-containing protein [Terriglobia bacterium]